MRARIHTGDVRSKLCNICSGFHYIILGGDFNCGATDWSFGDLYREIPAHACDHFLLETTDKFGFTQHVKSPTRKVSGITPDLAFSTISSLIQACHFVPGISDHDAILFEVDVAPKSAPKPPWRVYQFHKRNFEGFRARTSSFSDWCLHSHPVYRSVEQNLSNISASIKEAITKFIPSKMTKQKRHLSWTGPAIKRLINKRDRAYKKT